MISDAVPSTLEPKPHRAPAPLRVAMSGLGAVAPGLAGRIAEQLWFTPPRAKLSPRAAAFLASGRAESFFVGGRRVAGWSFGEGPAVVLLHGWGGLAAQLRSFVPPLVQAGLRAVLLDAPSHGASAPSRHGRRRATLFDFAEALEAVAATVSELAAVIAHSGGAAAAAWAMRRGLVTPRAVFLAPMASLWAYARLFQDALGLSAAAFASFRARVEQRLHFAWSDLEMSQVAAEIAAPPLLLVHDRHDPQTRWQDSVELAGRWPGAELVTTSGLGHRRLLHDRAVIERVVRFVSPASPLVPR